MRDQRGFSLLELLIAVTIIVMAMGAIMSLLIHNSRVNRSQQMTAVLQADARSCLAMIVQKMRSAGWDPIDNDIPIVTLDPDTGDDVSQIEIFADLDADGNTDGTDEQILIRHTGNVVEWRRTSNVSDPFETLAVHISNDADGDGTPEPMFVPDSTSAPSRIVVTITAQSPSPDPVTGEFIRYTVSSDVVLRKNL